MCAKLQKDLIVTSKLVLLELICFFLLPNTTFPYKIYRKRIRIIHIQSQSIIALRFFSVFTTLFNPVFQLVLLSFAVDVLFAIKRFFKLPAGFCLFNWGKVYYYDVF